MEITFWYFDDWLLGPSMSHHWWWVEIVFHTQISSWALYYTHLITIYLVNVDFFLSGVQKGHKQFQTNLYCVLPHNCLRYLDLVTVVSHLYFIPAFVWQHETILVCWGFVCFRNMIRWFNWQRRRGIKGLSSIVIRFCVRHRFLLMMGIIEHGFYALMSCLLQNIV